MPDAVARVHTLLKNLADALENPQWHHGKTRNDNIAREHGQQRQKAHLYAVDEMIDEYAILRHIVCESMLREKGWPLEIMARIHAFIDAAIGTATREFVGLEAQNNARNLVQQCDDLNLRAATAEKRMGVAQQQCADATSERDAGREDIAALLEESQVRERFVALLSHDLRSPLASIIMSAQRLERKPENVSSTTRIAQRVISAANRIDNMIQDMLDASRLRAGQKMFIKPSACDFVHVVAESCEEFAINYGKRIKFHAPKTASGHWDANALRRAIDNLVGNALKYGAKTTDVVLAVTDFSEKIRFSVHNYGNPLSTHEIDTLFQPFVRTKSAAAGGQSGWGLGLTLVRGVVEMHGGTLGALSSVENGTTFWFELPKSTVETRTAGNT